jgi:hypothetical protein
VVQSKRAKLTYWISTAVFSLMMAFSGIAYLTNEKMHQEFTRIGFPSYFRIELAIAKLIGVCVLIFPFPEKLKEWAYTGFAIDLASAVIAHIAVGDDARKVVNPIAVGVIFLISYLSQRKLHTQRHFGVRPSIEQAGGPL